MPAPETTKTAGFVYISPTMLKALVFIAAIVPGTAFLPSALPLPGKIHNLKCYQNTRKAGNDLLGLRMGWLDAFTIDKMYGAAPGSKVDQVFDSIQCSLFIFEKFCIVGALIGLC